MALPVSGPLSIGDIAGEFGGTAPLSLSDYYGAGGAPASGPLAISDFYGASGGPNINFDPDQWTAGGAGSLWTLTKIGSAGTNPSWQTTYVALTTRVSGDSFTLSGSRLDINNLAIEAGSYRLKFDCIDQNANSNSAAKVEYFEVQLNVASGTDFFSGRQYLKGDYPASFEYTSGVFVAPAATTVNIDLFIYSLSKSGQNRQQSYMNVNNFRLEAA